MIKILHSFSLHFWEGEVLSTYHAKFYLKIRMRRQIILTLCLGFGRSPLLESKKTGRLKYGLALVNQTGSDVIFASHQNIVASFLCNFERSETSSKIFSRVITSKMPPRRCVVQYCRRVSDKKIRHFNEYFSVKR